MTVADITCSGRGAPGLLRGEKLQRGLSEEVLKMVNESKTKKKISSKQLGRVLGLHVLAIFVILVIFYFMLFSMWTVKVLEVVLGFLSLIIYMLIMASTAKGVADRDLLPDAKTEAFPVKGLVLASVVVILNFIIWGALKLSWAIGAPESVKVVAQVLFFLLTLPYNFFLNISGGDVSGIGVVLMFTAPFVCMEAGYFAGYKKWDIFEKLDKIVFEKKINK